MHRHTAQCHRRYRAIATPENRSALEARGYASAHHDYVSGRGRVNGRVRGHHRANGHVKGRVRDRGHHRVDGHDRGRHHAHVHRRARDCDYLRVNGRGHVDGRVRANGRAGAGADVHVHGWVHYHCNTASCFW